MLDTAKKSNKSAQTAYKGENMLKMTWRRIRKDKTALLGGIVILLFILIAVFAPLLSPFDPYAIDKNAILKAPSSVHPFGTDQLGRDVLSRMIYGSRYSLILGFAGSVISMAVGIIIGCIAGYYGKWVENLILRICDVWSSIPGNILTIIISASLGSGFVQTMIALTIGSIPGKIRMLRAQILRERSEEYLEAAQSYNCTSAKIMFIHLLPNVISPLLVSFTMGIGATIMSAAGLSYLGLGIQPPTPEWGAMLTNARQYVSQAPFMMIFPGLMIAIVVLSINLFGDGFRDAMDPKLKK